MLIQSALNSLEKELNKAKYESMGVFDIILTILLLFGICFGFACLGWWIEYLLWGAIMVKVFGLPALTFWQVAGFDILLNFLIPHSSNSHKSDN